MKDQTAQRSPARPGYGNGPQATATGNTGTSRGGGSNPLAAGNTATTVAEVTACAEVLLSHAHLIDARVPLVSKQASADALMR